MPFFGGWAWSKKRYTNGLIVHLSSAPLLWDGLILVQDVRGHVIQVLQSLASHAACHKGPQSVTGKRAKRAQLETVPTYHPNSIHSFHLFWRQMTLNGPTGNNGNVKNTWNQFTSQAVACGIVQTTCTDVAITLLLLHWDHLWPNVATLDGWVDLRDVLQIIPRMIPEHVQKPTTMGEVKRCKDSANSELWGATFCLAVPYVWSIQITNCGWMKYASK